MLTTLLLYALLAVIAVGVLFALAVFLLPRGEQIAPPAPDVRPWASLPDRTLHAGDVASVRLPVALRGYRFAETDLLLDRLGDELRVRDEEIARLRGDMLPRYAAPIELERPAQHRAGDAPYEL